MFYWFRLFVCVFFSFPFCCCCCCVCIAYDKCKYVSGLICQTWKIIAVGIRITYSTFSGAIKLIIVLFFFFAIFRPIESTSIEVQSILDVCLLCCSHTYGTAHKRIPSGRDTTHNGIYIYLCFYISYALTQQYRRNAGDSKNSEMCVTSNREKINK